MNVIEKTGNDAIKRFEILLTITSVTIRLNSDTTNLANYQLYDGYTKFEG